MDADVYSSTIEVLSLLFERCRLRVGTVIAFDELFGPVWQLKHEYRALTEASDKWGVSYRWLSYSLTPRSSFARASVQVSGIGEKCERQLEGEQLQHNLREQGLPRLEKQTHGEGTICSPKEMSIK
ncbi:MAG: hypothetical protein SGPRY_002159 [Prymnesium sp.]